MPTRDTYSRGIIIDDDGIWSDLQDFAGSSGLFPKNLDM